MSSSQKLRRRAERYRKLLPNITDDKARAIVEAYIIELYEQAAALEASGSEPKDTKCDG